MLFLCVHFFRLVASLCTKKLESPNLWRNRLGCLIRCHTHFFTPKIFIPHSSDLILAIQYIKERRFSFFSPLERSTYLPYVGSNTWPHAHYRVCYSYGCLSNFRLLFSSFGRRSRSVLGWTRSLWGGWQLTTYLGPFNCSWMQGEMKRPSCTRAFWRCCCRAV